MACLDTGYPWPLYWMTAGPGPLAVVTMARRERDKSFFICVPPFSVGLNDSVQILPACGKLEMGDSALPGRVIAQCCTSGFPFFIIFHIALADN